VETDPDGPSVRGSTDQFVARPDAEGTIRHGVVDWQWIEWDEEPAYEFFSHWFCNGTFLYAEVEGELGHASVKRHATEAEVKRLRAPHWIEGCDPPECCGRPMFFVGQLWDGDLWKEAPPDARLWWHDLATFLVFTCSQCCEVKAVGQQY